MPHTTNYRVTAGRLSTYSELEQLQADDMMLQTIILILKRAIKNETWASINWQLPSPLNALALLTINRHNVDVVTAKHLDDELLDLLVKVAHI
jgi:hypothetical protein